MASNGKPERKVVSLDDLVGKVSKRGRKSTVTPEDIATVSSLAIGEGMVIEDYTLDGDAFARYRAERIGRYATHDDPEASVLNAWQSRHRQRVTALSKASGVTLTPMFTADGMLVAGRTA
jgi:hypothetical protein